LLTAELLAFVAIDRQEPANIAYAYVQSTPAATTVDIKPIIFFKHVDHASNRGAHCRVSQTELKSIVAAD
jgi:hypothetical protein